MCIVSQWEECRLTWFSFALRSKISSVVLLLYCCFALASWVLCLVSASLTCSDSASRS